MTSPSSLPTIGIPIGDPAGVGPEIVVKALAHQEVYSAARPIVVGNRAIIEQAIKITKSSLQIKAITQPKQATVEPGILNLVDISNIDLAKFSFGKVNAMCGQAAFDYIKKAVELASNKELDAIATTPINKEALKAANINYIGHTEILAGLTNTADPLTIFETCGLRVFFLTRHVSLRKACDLVKKDRIVDYIMRCSAALKDLGITEGTMAVAGLNPHCGEHGLFGDEEGLEIEPAVSEARKLGYDVVGPIGPDSVFHLAHIGRFNSVLSLYHDQGHIATKTLDFERTISITAGLPFLRTSVDHGTAFDIAGTGTASEVSMVEAIKLAAKYSK